jgi:hypothetical protein
MRRVLVLLLAVASCSAHAAYFGRFRKEARSASKTVFNLLVGPSSVSDIGSNATAITYSRTASRACATSDTSIAIVTANNPCIINGALLIEGSIINYSRFSEDFSNGVFWVKSNVTVTTDTAASPDGATTADTLESTVNGGYIEQQTVPGASTLFTSSVWVRAVSGTVSDVKLVIRNQANDADLCSSTHSVTTAWQRISLSCVVTSQSAWQRIYPSSAGTASIYAFGAQFERTLAPTSYTPSLSSVTTRGADVVSFATPANWPLSRGCVSVTYKPVGSTGGSLSLTVNTDGINTLLASYGSATQNGWAFAAGNGDKVFLDHRINGASTSNTTDSALSWSNSTSYVLRAGWDGAAAVISRDGTALPSTGALTVATSNKATTYVGNRADNARMAWGWISALKVGTSPNGCN